MSQPTPAVLVSHRLKRPEDFSREQLSKLMVKVHQECEVTLAETACFLDGASRQRPDAPQLFSAR